MSTHSSTTEPPVYKAAGFIGLSGIISDSYKKKLDENVFKPSPFLDLLKQKTEAAAAEMRKELDQQLWGGSYTKPLYRQEYPKAEDMERNEFLRKCIADAYDEVMSRKAETVTAVDKVMEERKEEKAREVFDYLDGFFAELDKDVIAFEITFDVKGKTYEYAARLTEAGLWFLTGAHTTGLKPEAFKGWLVEKALEAHEVVLEGTVL